MVTTLYLVFDFVTPQPKILCLIQDPYNTTRSHERDLLIHRQCLQENNYQDKLK